MGDPEENRWPSWLKPLLEKRFFVKCTLHGKSPKSECNMYCLDCTNKSLCSLCLTHHKSDHRTIQIRKLSYHYVIKVDEIGKYLDISNIKTYVTNKAQVVYLNERSKSKINGRAPSGVPSYLINEKYWEGLIEGTLEKRVL